MPKPIEPPSVPDLPPAVDWTAPMLRRLYEKHLVTAWRQRVLDQVDRMVPMTTRAELEFRLAVAVHALVRMGPRWRSNGLECHDDMRSRQALIRHIGELFAEALYWHPRARGTRPHEIFRNAVHDAFNVRNEWPPDWVHPVHTAMVDLVWMADRQAWVAPEVA